MKYFLILTLEALIQNFARVTRFRNPEVLIHDHTPVAQEDLFLCVSHLKNKDTQPGTTLRTRGWGGGGGGGGRGEGDCLNLD